MPISYDFHIHSALSPCADNENTPENITAMAAVKGLDAIAVSDHNSIKNVQAVMECGEAFGVTVVPSIEVQTNEEIHVLALFKTYAELSAFFDKLTFPDIKNDEEIFGNQLIVDSDGNIVGKEEQMLLLSSDIGIYELVPLILSMGGRAVPAHIDRDANGILAILGEVPPDLPFSALEFSHRATAELRAKYADYKQIVSSDAHHLEDMLDAANVADADSADIQTIFDKIL